MSKHDLHAIINKKAHDVTVTLRMLCNIKASRLASIYGQNLKASIKASNGLTKANKTRKNFIKTLKSHFERP